LRPDDHVTKLSSRSPLPSINLTVKNDPGTDTLSDQNQNEIPGVNNFGATKPKLGQGNSVGVVIYHNGLVDGC
jgi:hypothetical protein